MVQIGDCEEAIFESEGASKALELNSTCFEREVNFIGHCLAGDLKSEFVFTPKSMNEVPSASQGRYDMAIVDPEREHLLNDDLSL